MIGCHKICPHILCIFSPDNIEVRPGLRTTRQKRARFCGSCPVAEMVCSACTMTLHWRDSTTLSYLDHRQGRVLSEQKVIWVPWVTWHLWGPWLLRFDQRFSYSQFCPGEGHPTLMLLLLGASPEAFELGHLFPGSHQMELLQSSGSAGGQVPCGLTCKQLRAVVVAAWAIAAVGEITRPQGECLKLL